MTTLTLNVSHTSRIHFSFFPTHYKNAFKSVYQKTPKPLSLWGMWTNLMHQFLGPTPLTAPNGSSIAAYFRTITPQILRWLQRYAPSIFTPKIALSRRVIFIPRLLASSLDPADLRTRTASTSSHLFCLREIRATRLILSSALYTKENNRISFCAKVAGNICATNQLDRPTFFHCFDRFINLTKMASR